MNKKPEKFAFFVFYELLFLRDCMARDSQQEHAKT